MFGPKHINRLVVVAALVAAAASISSAQTVLHVDADSPYNGPGNNWEYAYHDLQAALVPAGAGTEIRVAQGTYKPSSTGYRWATFQLLPDVSVVGGFAGYGETNPDLRDPAAFVTILSGDLGSNDGPEFASRSDNSFHVLSATDTDSATMLDGFVITGGYASGSGSSYQWKTGAAVNCTNLGHPGHATFANCIFRDNWAVTVGGAICSFKDSHLKFINCAFTGNHADGAQGGAIYGSSTGNSLTMTNCTVVGNYAYTSGGGVYWSTGDTASITNCTFAGNQSGGAGSVGGFYAGGTTANVSNCIFWENSSAQLSHPTPVLVNHNAIQGGWTGGTGNITLNVSNRPLFVDADGEDDTYGTEDDDLHLAAGSPCLDAGDQTLLPADVADLDGDGDTGEATPFDLDGNARVVGDYVDMGAYEGAVGPANEPPTAVAGGDQAIHAGVIVFLDGSASFDDNDASQDLAYAWTLTQIPAGSTAVLANADTIEPWFFADLPGTYVASLVVTDTQDLLSEPDTLTVSSLNLAPTAVAGGDVGAVVGDPVSLDGTGSLDPDDDPFTYCWSITQAPGGSTAALDDPTIDMPSFTPDLPGAYHVQLVVNDGFEDSAPDEVVISVISAEDFAEIQTMDALNIVGELPKSSVTTKGNQKALGNFLTQVIGALQIGDTEEAINKLNKTLSRTDGCALRGAPDGNGPGRDWITNCGDQAFVYDLLSEALNALTE